MEKGDDDQQQPSLKPEEEISQYYAIAASWSNSAPYTSSTVSSNTIDLMSYNDIVKVLSDVELPSPSQFLSTSSIKDQHNLITFHEGQPSGTPKNYDTEGNIDRKDEENENVQEHGIMQFVAPKTHNTSQQRASRSRIPERIRALKALVPNCNKNDQASILDDVIAYIKSLQMRLQTMQCMKVAPYFTMIRPMNIGVGGYAGPPGQHCVSCFTNSSFPTIPLFVSRYVNPFLRPPSSMEVEVVGTAGSPRFLSIQQRPQFLPSHETSEPAVVYSYSTTSSSSNTNCIVPTTGSQVGGDYGIN